MPCRPASLLRNPFPWPAAFQFSVVTFANLPRIPQTSSILLLQEETLSSPSRSRIIRRELPGSSGTETLSLRISLHPPVGPV